MSSFEFTVNKSFLDGSGHPITIPKSQLAYEELRSLGLDHKHVVVTLPRGERYEAEIYHGTAGYGEYYQLRFTSGSPSLPSYLKINDRLVVFLENAGGRSRATLEYRA
jgi:hypothetical protein